MTHSLVYLPAEIEDEFEVYLNGVRQSEDTDYTHTDRALVFDRELRKDEISGWRWVLGAWAWGPTDRTTPWM